MINHAVHVTQEAGFGLRDKSGFHSVFQKLGAAGEGMAVGVWTGAETLDECAAQIG